jgi:hypothetical protein
MTMPALGILMGLVMMGSVFLEWEAAKSGPIVLEVHRFLGIEHKAFFSMLGHHLDFVPIVLPLALVLALVLAKSKPWKVISLIVALLCLAVSARDIRHTFPLEVVPGPGLWIFAAASLVAVIAAIGLIVGKKASPPVAAPSLEP